MGPPANMAQIIQPRPDHGLGFQARVCETSQVALCSAVHLVLGAVDGFALVVERERVRHEYIRVYIQLYAYVYVYIYIHIYIYIYI